MSDPTTLTPPADAPLPWTVRDDGSILPDVLDARGIEIACVGTEDNTIVGIDRRREAHASIARYLVAAANAAPGLVAAKDAAYDERNRCVAFMAQTAQALGWRVGLGRHDANDETWDRAWLNIVFIDTPHGQASWHIHDRDLPLFAGLPAYGHAWDGHTTPEKYERLARYRAEAPLFTRLDTALARVAALEAQLAKQAPVIEAARKQNAAWDQHSRNEVNDWMTTTGRTEDAIETLDKETP